MDHKNTTALITGASSGLGEQFARRLAERGANLILVARRKDRLDELAGKLCAEFGVNVAVYDRDLSASRAGTALAERIAADGLDRRHPHQQRRHGDPRRLRIGQDPDALAARSNSTSPGLVDLTRALLPQMVRARAGAHW